MPVAVAEVDNSKKYSYDYSYKKSMEYFDGNELAAKIFVDKYCLRDNDGSMLELTPDDMHHRLAKEFARIESGKFKEPMSYDDIYQLLHRYSAIIPQGSPLYGIGNKHQVVSLSNCFVLDPPQDSYAGILDVDEQLVQISKRRGGVGIDLSNLRPEGSRTHNAALTSTGIVSWMTRYSNSIREVGQNGRRGALMETISVHHPQILDFITAKNDDKSVTGANISVRLTDEFLQALQKNTNYELRWPVDSTTPKISHMIKAKEIWDAIIHNAWLRAEPGIMFWDHIIRESPADCYDEFESVTSNPCLPRWSKLLTTDGIKTLDDINVGDTIWSQDGWTTVKRKWCTGIKNVWKYTTNYGVFYGTKNHRVMSKGNKVEVDRADYIDSIPGPRHQFVCERQSIIPEATMKELSEKYNDVYVGMFNIYEDEEISCFFSNNREVLEELQCELSANGILWRIHEGDIASNYIYGYKYALHAWGTNSCGWNQPLQDDKIINTKYVSNEKVFDIEVDNDSHTFWCNGCSVSNCSEIILPPMDSCRLLAINLFSCIVDPFSSNARFNFDYFYELAQIAQRFMDNLIDLEEECINRIISKITSDPEDAQLKARERKIWERILHMCQQGRRTGLGITCLGDVMASLGIQYGSQQSLEFTDKVYKTLKLGAYRSSVDMAKELGAFPVWDHKVEKNNPFLNRIKDEDSKLWADMKKYGRRNIALLTTAPTGTVSTQAGMQVKDKWYHGSTSGIEPCYDKSCVRRKKGNPGDSNFRSDFIDETGDHWMHFDVDHWGVEAWKDVGVTDQNPYDGACSADIDWINRVKLQAIAQKHVDHSISSTINLPSDVKEEVISDIYKTAWKSGVKGITVYRQGCRSGVLIGKDDQVDTAQEDFERPKDLPCDVYHISVKSKPYFVLVGLYNGVPYEVFCGKNGHIARGIKTGIITKILRPKCYKVMFEDGSEICPITIACTEEEELITRLTSLNLRSGASMQLIVGQLEKTTGDLHSFSKSIARALKKYIPDGAEEKGGCPVCNQEALVRESGCVMCKSCGYSKCL